MNNRLVIIGAEVLLILGMVLPAFARLGETPAQCAERYGQPSALSTKDTKRYHKGDFGIVIHFMDGKAAMLQFIRDARSNVDFDKARQFSEEEMDSLLNANSDGKEWKVLKTNKGVTSFKLSDSDVYAKYELHGYETVLTIETEEYQLHLQSEIEAGKADEKKKMDGF